MDNITRMDHLDPNIDVFLDNVIKKNSNEMMLHNIYELKLIDKDTNDVDTYYGMNLMTNWFFKNRYMGDADTISRDCYIMIGDGIDATHQPSVDNRAMYHIITNTYKSNDMSQSFYPVEYRNTDRMILQTMKVCKTKYDYNINGYDSNITINEIGYGYSQTILYSHSKVYDINGNEKTIIKRPNQSLEITFYWKISVPESVFTSLEANGIYGAISPHILLFKISNNVGNKPRIYPYLRNSARTLAGSANYQQADMYVKSWYSYFGSTDYGGTITQNDDGSRTWDSSPESYVLETDKFDSVTSVLYRDNAPGNITGNKCHAFSDNIMLFKYFKLPSPETIETIVKTTMFYNCNFYNIMGVNYQYRTRNHGYNEDPYASRYLRGYLPVVDMDIQSVHRYNFSTSAFDVEETFNNPKQNDYDLTGFHCAGYQWITWPDNKVRNSYVCANQNTTTRSITSFSGTGATCYATDKWWDVSTWELVSNTEAIDQSLQRKKYYIFDKTISLANSYSTLSVSQNYWIPNPQTQYTNGVHKINEQFERHVDETNALLYANNNSIRYITHANEDYNFYVQNNIVFRRPETQFSICPAQYIFNNVNSIFSNVIPDVRWVYIGNQLITTTGKLIYLVKSYVTNTQPGVTREAYGIRFCITNLALQDDAINASTKAVSINDKFTHTLATIDNYVCVTHGKYLLCYGYNELVIYNTDTDDYWLYPYKINKVREIHGTSKIILDPSSDNNQWTIYDCDTKQITHQFDIPNDYAPTKFLAFEDWVYIYATYGSTHAMLLYTISTQELKQIEYPSILDSYAFYGFTQYYNATNYSTNSVSSTNTDYFISNASKYNSCGVQYKDGILCIVSPDYYNSFIIISRYNPEHIISQSTFLSESEYGSAANSALIQLCKIYENYYVGFTVDSTSSGYDRSTKFYDVGRIIRNDNAFTSSDESEYQVDYLCFNRDGMSVSDFNVMTAYKNKIYAYGNYFSGCNVEVLPPEGIITHKIKFKTYTITRWNNPKKITLPKLSFTLTNIINHN